MTKARIFYHSLPDDMRRRDKLDWFRENKLENIPFTHLLPDEKHNWINMADNDFETLVPMVDREVKAGRKKEAIFELFTNGVATNRDSWVYDFDRRNLLRKMRYFTEEYNSIVREKPPVFRGNIKWSRDLKQKCLKGLTTEFSENKVAESTYRPYTKLHYYTDKIFSDVQTNNHYQFFGQDLKSKNKCIWLKIGPEWSFFILAIDSIPDLLPQGGSICLPLYYNHATGTRHDNITDWGLAQFRSHYTPEAVESASPVCYDTVNDVMADYQPRSIEKEDIFHYTYAVLHDPAYRTKYELNLKREFPRLPFYANFWQWASWGKELMDLHIGYESVEPYPLKRTDVPVLHPPAPPSKGELDLKQALTPPLKGGRGDVLRLKVKLKANKESGTIEIDEETTLSGIPPEAWDYKLGNRSALEWVLDQYKEKKPSDPTIAEQFNTYRFADYKEVVMALLGRVCAVSLGTVAVVDAMKMA